MDHKDSKVSPNFPKDDETDIIIRSSDGILFHLHRKNLETHSAAFSGVEWIPSPSDDEDDEDEFGEPEEVVQLSEPSPVLDLLFHRIYPRPQPNLDDAEFVLFAQYAEAIEKYEVFSAMDMCLHRMKRAVQSHPLLVIKYAMKHGKHPLADAAAPFTLKTKSRVIVDSLPSDLALIWFLYRENWQNAITQMIQQIPDSSFIAGNFPEAPSVCPYWVKWRDGITSELPHAMSERDIRIIFGRYQELLDKAQHTECDCASHLPNNWEDEAVSTWKSMQRTFSSFSKPV